MSSNLYQQIQKLYDSSSPLWEKTWGEHMHHGYYGEMGTRKVSRRQAQIDLIWELLHWAGLTTAQSAPQQILDVGCGIGGSTLVLAQYFGAKATGITLSPVQARRAQERAQAAGLEQSVQFHVADALHTPFADGIFDLVWSLESGEHMPDKTQFLRECYRVLKPGGTLLMVTWCHRSPESFPGELTEDEKQHLDQIYRVYCLPYVISLPEYEKIASECGFRNLRVDDWSQAVAPFWDVVIESIFNPTTLLGLLQSGWMTIQAALSLGLMSRGYQRGLVRFGLLYGQKRNDKPGGGTQEEDTYTLQT